MKVHVYSTDWFIIVILSTPEMGHITDITDITRR